MTGRRTLTLEQIRATHVELLENGCWNWLGKVNHDGRYGQVTYKKKTWMAHRLTYALFHDSMPPWPGLEIDHLCRNDKCVNPEHLELVTHSENMLRAPRKGKKSATHCKRGHELTPANTEVRVRKASGRPRRLCKTCEVERRQAPFDRRTG